ncbi:hypothetical protein ACFLUV_05095 [Elusimicrobiota bacterium]
MNKKLVFIIVAALSVSKLFAGAGEVEFIAELPTSGEYTLFANGGWNGNWYVGYEHGWISKLPPIKTDGFEKVHIGARLGRAKTLTQIKKVIKSQEAEGKKVNASIGPLQVLIGVSNVKDVKPAGVLLTNIEQIPLEGSPVMALEQISESRWFWVEVNKSALSSDAENYIHIWSENEELNSVDTAPILAAGTGSNKKDNSYLKKGNEIKTIKYFEPALAIKLVGEDPPSPVIEIEAFESHPIYPMKNVIRTKVSGDYITEVQIEQDNGSGWKSKGKALTSPPYDLILDFKELPAGEYKLRCRVKNWWENVSYSNFKTFSIQENQEE